MAAKPVAQGSTLYGFEMRITRKNSCCGILSCEVATTAAFDDNGIPFVEYECASVYRALVGHFGGKDMLFAALWNSRLPLEEQEPFEVVVDLSDYLPEKTEIWAYIEEGMANWSWE